MKNIFLTSAIIAVMSYPAIALDANNHIEPSPETDCVESTLGTATGPANLEADWTANTINLEWYNEDTKLTVPTTSNTCTYDGGITLPSTNPTKTGYTFKGWQVRQTLDLMALIGVTEAGASNAYIDTDGQFSENSASHGQSYYGINGANTWAVDYGSSKGMLVGQARCSTRAGATNTWANSTYNVIDDNFVSSLTDETGQTGAKYCYCGVTGYKDTNGNMQSLSSAWVFLNAYRGTSLCTSDCAYNCSNNLASGRSDYRAFRAAVLGAVQ